MSNVPAVPLVPEVQILDAGAIRVSWTPPHSVLPIQHYTVAVNKDGDASVLDFSTGALVAASSGRAIPGDVLQCDIKGLESGPQYSISVSAKSGAGWGSYSQSREISISVPEKPLLPEVQILDAGAIRVSWMPPHSVLPISHYRVAVKKDGDASDQSLDFSTGALVAAGSGRAIPGNLSQCDIKGLESGPQYSISVSAKSAAGWGSYSQSREISISVPEKPLLPEVQKLDAGAIRVSWMPPHSVLPISHYRVAVKKDGDASDDESDQSLNGSGRVIPGNLLQCDIKGLESGPQYSISVSAKSAAGWSSYSQPGNVMFSLIPTSLRLPIGAASCKYWQECRAALKMLLGDESRLDHLLDTKFDLCFCHDCHQARGDNMVYQRGSKDDFKDYVLPVGFARVGVCPGKSSALSKIGLSDWHICYHGTKHENLLDLLISGHLITPGCTTYKGTKISVRPGHIGGVVKRVNEHTGKCEEFDPTGKVFFSPSVKYCNYKDVYMNSLRVNGKLFRFALQVRLQPQTYYVGQQTVGARLQIDPHISNGSIEWYTEQLHTHFFTGVLICQVPE